MTTAASFEEAAVRFSEFLSHHGIPARLCWCDPRDVIFAGRTAYVRVRSHGAAEQKAKQQFERGMARGLGVQFTAFCEIDGGATCFVSFPTSSSEAERSMMPADCGLKMSVLHNRPIGRAVASPLRWALLRLLHRRQSQPCLLRIVLLLFLALTATSFAPQQNSIRQIDFKNFTYPWNANEKSLDHWRWNQLATPTTPTFQLVNGRYSFARDPAGQTPPKTSPPPALVFESVTYGDLLGDGTEQAAVDPFYDTGGIANWHYLYLYTVRAGAPKLLAWLHAGARAYGGLVHTAIQNHDSSSISTIPPV